MSSPTFLGIDFGTSGARAIVINLQGDIQSQATRPFTQQTTTIWQASLFELIQQLPVPLRQSLRAIAINGTSSTVLLCDTVGRPLDAPILYNDDRGAAVLDQVRAIAPAQHTVISATSSLAKLLWWIKEQGIKVNSQTERPYFLHQADWLAFLLHGKLGISDYHNALKLGYDIEHLRYPDWLQRLQLPVYLPDVLAPGQAVAPIRPTLASQFQIPTDCLICAGTTDSIAAFLASGASQLGEAVTSLGSTLVLKLLSQTRLEDTRYGIYSHRLGNRWLVGGASNTGGAVLKQFFNQAELQQLSLQIQPDQPSSLDYYPLLKPGERFPINDPTLTPRLEPRPDQPVAFLHGLLESMARIEAQGYQLLQQLGAAPVTRVYTAGGGAQNPAWTAIRARHLQVPVLPSAQTEAAYGTARLAQRSS
ncbi:FGGY-family carbohydrate kinase [Leptolyngbya sp. NK1-12]|uniref:D-ribulose kinase n=1 Tax=Leptolyngbya sp. NK1-12 TaxID=2547451 RepID=A0AA96WIA4_9CYAN|nr:FGGY-family carbohydrate kinase [Leptolyngbya sp. NK1-12]WNZ21851.1 FGGY-family carbohydrate kinase [Leptolyngbya sp. NK1-12]